VLRNFPGLYTCAFLFLLITALGCAKIDSTNLGSDLIPAVDNVTTFADTLNIEGTQGTFSDTARIPISDLHVLGAITNDPVFGKVNAEVFLEMKPTAYPYYFGAAGDVIDPAVNDSTGFDSVVLCLSVKSYYGDTIDQHQKFKVYKITNPGTNFVDSLYRLNYRPDNGNWETEMSRIDSGLAEIDPRRLGDTVHYPGSAKATVINQLRIKLKKDFLDELVANRDTSAAGNGPYRNDVNFRSLLKGFAIVPDLSANPNGLFYVNITDATTRLEIHYRKKSSAGIIDTSFSSFTLFPRLDTAISRSAQANYLHRDSSGTELVSRDPDALYMLASPGTYATLSIPGLDTFKNSIIHRAEIIVEQTPSSSPEVDKILIPPAYLYLDLVDTVSTSHPFKPVYFDLNTSNFYDPDNSTTFFPAQGINFNYFGGYLRSTTGASGDKQYYYIFNISRYVQNIVTNHAYNYKLRLYAPNEVHYYNRTIPFGNNRAAGRIKIGNGNNPNHKLRMRIVYSKL
jgi:hypothetical protein